MPSLLPLVSSPESASSTSTSHRRLVKPLRRARDFDFEKSRRAASMRGRKRRQQMRSLVLCGALPLGIVTLWVGARAYAAAHSLWPSGSSVSTGISCESAPVAVGSNWFFVSDDGALWRSNDDATAPKKVWAGALSDSPQVVGMVNGLIVAGGDGTLSFLNVQGRTQWSIKNQGALSSRPAVLRSNSGTAIVGGDDAGHIWARSAANGNALWQVDARAPIGEGVAATPWGIVAPTLGSAAARGGLRCFAALDGKPLWNFPANPRERASGTALPRFDATTNRLFWCNDQGAVFALDARTGRKIWKTFVSPRPNARNVVVLRASPVLANGVLVVGGNDGGLRAFDARNGHALWTRWLDQPLSSALGKARFHGRVVVVAGTKPVSLVDAQSGQLTRQLGTGVVGWSGHEFAAADEAGIWRFWAS